MTSFQAREGLDPNPLKRDPLLFEMYMDALDHVLGRREIQTALEEYGMAASRLRLQLTGDAPRVFSRAAPEFRAYQTLALKPDRLVPDENELGVLRPLAVGLAVLGGLSLSTGVLGGVLGWTSAWIALWAGAALVVAAVTAWLIRARMTFLGRPLLSGEGVPGYDPELDRARSSLISALGRGLLLEEVREVINDRRVGQFGTAFLVTGSPGLYELHDSIFTVPTRTAQEVQRLLDTVSGISLGIAGPRGAGKSTIIRYYCDPSQTAGDDLRCMVSAPVDYAARDFVLHLFSTFCKSVIRHYSARPAAGKTPGRRLLAVMSAARRLVSDLAIDILLLGAAGAGAWFLLPDPWPLPAVALVGAAGLWRGLSAAMKIIQSLDGRPDAETRTLIRAARSHLARVRFLQSHSLNWTGSIKLPVGLEGQAGSSVARAEQPLSYPEAVEQFRAFAHRVATFADRKGHSVFIGVDELDKIGTAEQAERFLNEIKGIFGLPHVYFMVSVSDDALMTFERRGLPLRDAFDSSFDEILRVGALDYAESRRLLYRRIIGLHEPYVALCHILAGGLARDLLRTARQLVRLGHALSAAAAGDSNGGHHSSFVDYLFTAETGAAPTPPPMLTELSAALIAEELRRKARATVHTGVEGQCRALLYETAYGIAGECEATAIVDALLDKGPLSPLMRDFAAYAYFCETLREFIGRLDGASVARCVDERTWPGSFDALAGARYAFAVDAEIAWETVSAFRTAWRLPVRRLV
ncbi:hypothetical protein [Nonomuraea soli]|uniref:KAP NTPase domain-containing protein n=1 Tax=Nonomuraea soli TaxID=1032476 RepID=A0A7W0CFC5_9ACTN|nr:hypothetical protein [Nonomuraea soli]MBA2890118.1 hypothetical protein [Nonomuraea soli]